MKTLIQLVSKGFNFAFFQFYFTITANILMIVIFVGLDIDQIMPKIELVPFIFHTLHLNSYLNFMFLVQFLVELWCKKTHTQKHTKTNTQTLMSTHSLVLMLVIMSYRKLES